MNAYVTVNRPMSYVANKAVTMKKLDFVSVVTVRKQFNKYFEQRHVYS